MPVRNLVTHYKSHFLGLFFEKKSLFLPLDFVFVEIFYTEFQIGVSKQGKPVYLLFISKKKKWVKNWVCGKF